MKRWLLLCSLSLLPWLAARADIQQALQLIDYVGADYRGAVADGRVANAGEYQEMQDFIAGIGAELDQLPENAKRAAIVQQGHELAQLVERKAAPADVATLTARLRLALVDAYAVGVVPRQVPDIEHGHALFTANCAACHGAEGKGDGPQSRGLDPHPTNFTDHDRYRQRTLFGLYNTITRGVPDTAMRAFSNLSDQDRWSLAFYVGQLAVPAADIARGETLFHSGGAGKLSTLQALTLTTPAEAEKNAGAGGAALMAYLRAQPAQLFSSQSPLSFTRARLADSLAAYRSGDRTRAYQLAVEAYLEGFELVEQGLDAVDADLRHTIEAAMTGLRSAIRAGQPVDQIAAEMDRIGALLNTASERLHSVALSGGAAFGSAFFILLREGLEALLVVAALAAFLAKTGREDGMRYLHAGWLGALGAGFLTWLVSVSLIEISGASREITEGVASLMSAAVLFYVGFWLHDKTHAAQWQRFIRGNVEKALNAGTLWGIAGLSFVAVYREVFETILFYQALWVQADAGGRSMALGGLGVGVVALAVLAWLVIRYSMRLPLRQFFGASGLLMFVLAVVFAGKGVAAMQEAGYLPVNPVHFPRVDLLGIYPNLQGLAVQLVMLALGLYLFFGMSSRRARSAEAHPIQ